MRLRETQNPLREKLTLFWHNHFATSNAKVHNAGYMLGKYDLMRRHALGNFRDLLQEMSKDPAMMVWLDTSQSKKGNAERELRPRADGAVQPRHRPLHREGHPRGRPRLHRLGDQGRQGVLQSEPARRRRQRPSSARPASGPAKTSSASAWSSRPARTSSARKLYRFLVSETIPPTPELLEPLAEQFRKSDYDFGALVATVLRSNLFFSPEAYRTQRQVAGRVRPRHRPRAGRQRPMGPLWRSLEGLGQRLFIRRRSRAGTAARPGSTARRCSSARTWRWP